MPQLSYWLKQSLGHRITPPGGIGGSCVDALNAYIAYCYATPHVYANAVQWAGRSIPGWRWIANTPTNNPLRGDIVVWEETPAHGIGPDGHVAICIFGDVNELLTVDQNWPAGNALDYNMHDYQGVLGWHTRADGLRL